MKFAKATRVLRELFAPVKLTFPFMANEKKFYIIQEVVLLYF